VEHLKINNTAKNEIKLIIKKEFFEINFFGNWTVESSAKGVEGLLLNLADYPKIRKMTFATKKLDDWDSFFMAQLMVIIDFAKNKKITVDIESLPKGIQGLLALAYSVSERDGARKQKKKTSLIELIGRSLLKAKFEIKNLVTFLGDLIHSSFSLIKGTGRFRFVDLMTYIQDCGPASLPIVSLISFLVGLILAFVGALQLSLFGAQMYLADLVGLGMTREMGALMVGIIMAGRTGASYAAQIGTMNVNSEIDALKTMGFNPMEFLVMPRMLALILVMPLLCLYADFMGMLGGAAVAIGLFDISSTEYWSRTELAVQLKDVLVGLFKASIFGILIAYSGCIRGMQCGRSASAVGDAATSAVVTGIIFIVISDSLITIIFNQLGI
jgi:phospholipid/cholesterol/gamma-HCH transport system permease protein